MCWHRWAKWESYEQAFTRVIKNKAYEGAEIRQKRKCEKCGKMQDVLVS